MTVGTGYPLETLTKVVCMTMGMGPSIGAFNQEGLYGHGHRTIRWSLVKKLSL